MAVAAQAEFQEEFATEIKKPSNKLQDWYAKEAYLSAHYASIEPLDFYQDLGFHRLEDGFRICVMHADRPKGKRFHRYDDIATMLKESLRRRDAYVFPASYYHSYSCDDLLHSVSCIYIDLDYVKTNDLERLCEHNFYGHVPSYVVDSGNGLHLVYKLQEIQPTYKWAKELLKTIHVNLLQAFADNGYHADMGTGLSHAYRIVGSKTKLGQVCTAYRVGNIVSLPSLAASVGVVWQRPQTRKYHYQTGCQGEVKPNARNSFYDYTVRGIAEKTVKGHRYNSLFALICTGYKCGYALDYIRQDVIRLAERLGLSLKEAEHAMDVCDPKKAVTVRSETLENWLGWAYERKTKRNGRTRAEHLAWVAETRVGRTVRKITDYLRQHVHTTISEASRALSMDRKTIRKYWEEIWAVLTAEAATKAEAEENTAATVAEMQNNEPVKNGWGIHCVYTSLRGELCSVAGSPQEKGEQAQRQLRSFSVSLDSS